MTALLPPLRLTGATILRGGVLQKRSLVIADGVITKGPLPQVDMSGYLILPGIIDLHGDAFERQVAPRRGIDVVQRQMPERLRPLVKFDVLPGARMCTHAPRHRHIQLQRATRIQQP